MLQIYTCFLFKSKFLSKIVVLRPKLSHSYTLLSHSCRFQKNKWAYFQISKKIVPLRSYFEKENVAS